MQSCKAFSENHNDKHNSKAKYEWYRYDTRFAIPKYDFDEEFFQFYRFATFFNKARIKMSALLGRRVELFFL